MIKKYVAFYKTWFLRFLYMEATVIIWEDKRKMLQINFSLVSVNRAEFEF